MLGSSCHRLRVWISLIVPRPSRCRSLVNACDMKTRSPSRLWPLARSVKSTVSSFVELGDPTTPTASGGTGGRVGVWSTNGAPGGSGGCRRSISLRSVRAHQVLSQLQLGAREGQVRGRLQCAQAEAHALGHDIGEVLGVGLSNERAGDLPGKG